MARSSKNFKKPGEIALTAVFVLFCFFLSSFVFLPAGNNLTQAATSPTVVNELKNRIERKNKEIEQIEKEIKQYQSELTEISKQANSLEGAIKSLNVTQEKLTKDISLTENRMESVNLSLDKLYLEIKENENKIDRNGQTLGEALRLLNEAGESSLVETFLKYDNIASFWDEVDNLQDFQVSIKQHLENLKRIKQILESQKKETEEKKNELEQLKIELDAQNEIVEVNKNQKAELLAETKNTEEEYKNILERNLARKAEFERELFEFESQLRIAIDPASIPTAQSGVLIWPLDDIFVTQFFGKTVDSKRLYVSGTHNGVDFRAVTGTAVKAALAGVISHVGNTDEVSGCYSFGKWILIKHSNGLSTLYSHLSSINVNVGQSVETGQTVAFSGGLPGTFGAGYSTGPHLHFGVYATEGLRPQNYRSETPCNGAYMPLADQKAYLDPISYLPPL
jgi:murein DD-endopeptidase MepM/ murein hydrolase activator NlpD